MKINRYDSDLPVVPHKLGIFEGSLWRAADPQKPFNQEVLRENYCYHHGIIRSVADLKASIRAGKHAWPGGYPLYFYTSDGAALSFEAVEENFRQVADSVRNKLNDGWRVIGCDINYEDADLVCAHTGEKIECAYG